MSKYGVLSGPYFPAFGLNTERYSVALRFQSECGKIRSRKTPYLDTFQAVIFEYVFYLRKVHVFVDVQHLLIDMSAAITSKLNQMQTVI